VAIPLLFWSDAHAGGPWLVAGLAAWIGVYIINLAGLFEATLGENCRFAAGDIALLHLNGLSVYLGVYLLLEPVFPNAGAPLAAVLALLNGVFGFSIVRRRRDEALHFGALAFTLLMIAVPMQFEGAWITGGWAAEGAVVLWLGLRERREWLRRGGLLLFAVAIVRLLWLLSSAPPVGQVLLLNRRALCGLSIVLLTYGLTWAHYSYRDRAKSKTATGVGLAAAKLLLLAVAASEIVAYWSLRVAPPFEPAAQVIQASLIVGAVIVWLGLRRQQEWLRGFGGAIVVLAADVLFSIQLLTAPVSYVPMLNGRATAGALAVSTLYALAFLHRRRGDQVALLEASLALLTTGASLLTLTFLTSEITAYWHVHDLQATSPALWPANGHFAREMMLSITWAAYATLLVVVGLKRKYAPIRYFAIAVFVVTIVKVFAIDLAELDRIYRVVSVVGLGVTLLLTSYLYQKLSTDQKERGQAESA
jgi:uncharacterized membrane protein